MRAAVMISVALHAAVLLWALAEFPSAREFKVAETPSLPVDLVTPEEFTRLKAGERAAKGETPKTAEKADDKAAAKPKDAPKPAPAPAAAAAPAPPPAPTPDEAPAPRPAEASEPEPAPAPKTVEPSPEPKPERKAAPAPPPPAPKPPAPKMALKPVAPKDPAPTPPAPTQRQAFNPDRIAALLNKVPDSGSKAPAAVADTPAPPAQGETRGRDVTLSLNDIDALRARIAQCWIPPVGGIGAEAIQVRLRLQLNPDGTLMRQPDVLDGGASPFFLAAADSAVRAVWQCQPYDLPPAKYAAWRDMILNFDPREMFGG